MSAGDDRRPEQPARDEATAEGKSGRRVWTRRLGRLILVVLVTWALYRALDLPLEDLDPRALARWRPDAWPIALSLLLLLGVYFAHAGLWRRIATDLGGQPVRLRDAIRIYFLSNLGRYLPGKIWQVAGYAALGREAGMSSLVALAAAALAQLAFLGTGIAFFTVLLPGRAGPVPILAATATVALLFALFYALRSTRVGVRLRDWIEQRLGEKAVALLEVGDRIRLRTSVLWVFGYAGSWVLLGAAFVAFTAAFVPEAAQRPGFVAGALAAGYVGGYIVVFAPAGVGVREGMLALLLAEVIPTQAAVLVAVASRVWFTAAELVPLGVVALLRGRSAQRLEGRDTREVL